MWHLCMEGYSLLRLKSLEENNITFYHIVTISVLIDLYESMRRYLNKWFVSNKRHNEGNNWAEYDPRKGLWLAKIRKMLSKYFFSLNLFKFTNKSVKFFINIFFYVRKRILGMDKASKSDDYFSWESWCKNPWKHSLRVG